MIHGDEKNESHSFLGKKTLRSEKESENLIGKEDNNEKEVNNGTSSTNIIKKVEKSQIKFQVSSGESKMDDVSSYESLRSEDKNNDKNNDKKNDKKEKKSKAKPKIKDLNVVFIEATNFISKLEKSNQNDKKNKNFNAFIILKNGFESFNDYEWDMFIYVLIKIYESGLDNYKEFQEDCSFYSYNNFRGLRLSKEFINKFKNPTNNEKLFEEALKFYKERNSRFLEVIKKYKIVFLNNQPNPTNKNLHTENTRETTNVAPTNTTTDINTTKTIIVPNSLNNISPNNNKNSDINNSNNNNKDSLININKDSSNNINKDSSNNNNKDSSNNNNNSTNNTINNNINNPNNLNNANNTSNNAVDNSNKYYGLLTDKYKLELFAGGLINNNILRTEKEREKYDKELKKDKSNNTIKIEVPNFNLNEESMMCEITGIKYINNISEINISGNMLTPLSCFWLGTIFKIHRTIKILDLTRCGITNECLYLFLEGTKFTKYENLNDQQLFLERLNLKDNNQITDTTNDDFEHPLSLLLKRFGLKWLNLTNAKLGNKGAIKFLKTFLELQKEDKIKMENLILICNEIRNEECLGILSEIVSKENKCPLKTLVLSKNFISISPEREKLEVNYFKKLMESIAENETLEELFLINCSLGKNPDDIDILYEMLCKNKKLISLRLFGNEFKEMNVFSKILGIFSEYNNGLKNNSLKSLDLSKNSCNIKITNDFLNMIEQLKLEYLDISQNTMDSKEKEEFRKRTNELSNIKIIY